MAMNGMPRQMLQKITVPWANSGSPRKLMFWLMMPRFFSAHEMIENWVSKIHQKAMADKTVGTMNGIRTTERISDLKRMLLLSSSARYSPRANFTALAMKV
jgi:hypothetical protein